MFWSCLNADEMVAWCLTFSSGLMAGPIAEKTFCQPETYAGVDGAAVNSGNSRIQLHR